MMLLTISSALLNIFSAPLRLVEVVLPKGSGGGFCRVLGDARPELFRG
jgi:hypothetical protein